jgi:hypothetical protein
VADWITPAIVAAYLGGDVADDDPRVVSSTAAVRAAVERRRSDLVFDSDVTVPADVREGAIAWAGLLYQSRSAPSGFAGYDADLALADAGSRRAEIMRLIGWRRPVVS